MCRCEFLMQHEFLLSMICVLSLFERNMKSLNRYMRESVEFLQISQIKEKDTEREKKRVLWSSIYKRYFITCLVSLLCNEMSRLFMHAIQNFKDLTDQKKKKTHPLIRLQLFATICTSVQKVYIRMEIVERLSSLFHFFD